MAKAKQSEEVILISPEQVKLITETIETKLATRNITEEVLSKYEKEFMVLKVNGIEDKDGLEKVYSSRQMAKKTRILVKEICEAGRAPLQAEAKKWIEKQNEITGRIEVIEDYLQAQEDIVEKEKERIREEKRLAEIARSKERVAELNKLGVVFNGAEYVLDELVFSDVVIKESTDEHFNDKILPQYKAIADAKAAIAKAAKEAQDLIDKQREESEREFERQKAEIKRQQEELGKKLEDQRKKDLAAAATRNKNRADQLEGLGLVYNFQKEAFTVGGGRFEMPHAVLSDLPDDEWDNYIRIATPAIEKAKKDLQDERDAEEKKRNDEAIKRAEEYRLEQERLDELKRQEAIETGKDKDKYAEVIAYLKKCPLYEMRSGQYRQKMVHIKDFLADLK